MLLLLLVRFVNVQVAFTMVDELCDWSPTLYPDNFYDVVDVDIPYNKSTVEYRDKHYRGSADVEEVTCCGCRSVLRKRFNRASSDRAVYAIVVCLSVRLSASPPYVCHKTVVRGPVSST